ncbi:MAG: DNA-processing protein DprA [Lautropia sp.]|nr:DNA-processing protein DprA [Lautropia sp.]
MSNPLPTTPFPDDAALAAWLRLTLTPGIGAITGQLLLRRLGSPEGIFGAPHATLRRLVRSDATARALLADDPQRHAQIHQALAWMHGSEHHHILTLDDPRYPSALLHLPDAPLLVYARGSLAALAPAAVAIVGSRRASHEGMRNAHALAEALARRDIVVTSGLAEGIDAAAHQGALAGARDGQASTIAITGAGIDRIYPACHQPLANQILEQRGLLLGEQPPGTAPLRSNFPRRNRMIAALSRGTLVAEAALKSGSLITARLAAELGRDVMAIPGSIHNPMSHGCHHLIRDGAALVETVDDILQALNMAAPAAACAAPNRHQVIATGRMQARRHVSRRARGWSEWRDIMGTAPTTEDTDSGTHQPPDAGNASRDESIAAPPHAISRSGNIRHHDDLNHDDGRQLLTRLANSPLSAEELARQLGWPIERILITIQLLELDGRISHHVDGRWQRLA